MGRDCAGSVWHPGSAGFFDLPQTKWKQGLILAQGAPIFCLEGSSWVCVNSPVFNFSKEQIMNALMTRGGLFDDFFKDIAPGFYVRPLHGDPLPSPAQIKVDVKETDKAYTVQAEVPGVSKDEIHVSVEGNVVTLRAEVKQEDSQGSDEKVLRSERYFGAVSRSFQLPMDIDQTQAKAKYDNGVLTLTLPKKLANASQRLTIE
jgi:HSP20 family protein